MLLAIDTASPMMSLALFDGQAIVAELSFRTQNQHTVQLSPQIQALLSLAGLTPPDIQAIGLAQGYGSYSGLRVGFGVAKGLALGLNCPLIAIPTLEISAAASPYLPQMADSPLLVFVPAGRKRVIAQKYHWGGEAWAAMGTAINAPWEELWPQVPRACWLSGEAAALPDSIPAGVQVLDSPWQIRRAGFLAKLAWLRYASKTFETNLALVNPLYLKDA
jgi:tRNA threonylcarbamoyladenosine biosynthesis protein TsaB